MMRRLFFEGKIMGINALVIFIALTLVMSLAAYFGGELLDLSKLGFEVISPFLTAAAVGEWGKTRADANFDIIIAQGNSLFKWVVARFLTAFLAGSLFAFLNMVVAFFVRKELPLWEMLMLYFPPAFFLSTLCALCGICISEEHLATLITGSFWLLSMLARGLLRIPALQYVYLFIRYAGDENGIWLVNKAILIFVGLALWLVIYLLYKKRVFMK